MTLFASADARSSAKLVSVRNQAIRLDPHPLKSDLAAHMSMLQELHLREDEFDVIHFHVDLIHFPFFEELAHKTVTTLHGRLDLKDLSEVLRALAAIPAGLDLERPETSAAGGQLGLDHPARGARRSAPPHA